VPSAVRHFNHVPDLFYCPKEWNGGAIVQPPTVVFEPSTGSSPKYVAPPHERFDVTATLFRQEGNDLAREPSFAPRIRNCWHIPKLLKCVPKRQGYEGKRLKQRKTGTLLGRSGRCTPSRSAPEKREEVIVHIDLSVLAPEPRRTAPKVGRNDPCPCGSVKKFKRCCGGAGATVN
jgi:SEC-C motif